MSKSLTLALFSYPEEFSSWSVDQSCHTYDTKHKPSLCFQTTVQTALAYTPYRLRPLEPNLMTVLALSKELCVPIPMATTLLIGSTSKVPEAIPIFVASQDKRVNLAHLSTYRHSDP